MASTAEHTQRPEFIADQTCPVTVTSLALDVAALGRHRDAEGAAVLTGGGGGKDRRSRSPERKDALRAYILIL